jgi:hypothetical protein
MLDCRGGGARIMPLHAARRGLLTIIDTDALRLTRGLTGVHQNRIATWRINDEG